MWVKKSMTVLNPVKVLSFISRIGIATLSQKQSKFSIDKNFNSDNKVVFFYDNNKIMGNDSDMKNFQLKRKTL